MLKNQEYDVAIVGTGPAGCITAYYLSKKYKTLLLDRSDFPRDKPCGGLLIEESQEFLKGFGMPSYVFSRPKYLGVKYIDWDSNIEIGQKRKIWNISRKKFDYWLLKLCCKNINFSPRTTFLKYRKERSGLKVFIKKNGKESNINTKYLVFATGSSLAIRKIFTDKKITKSKIILISSVGIFFFIISYLNEFIVANVRRIYFVDKSGKPLYLEIIEASEKIGEKRVNEILMRNLLR